MKADEAVQRLLPTFSLTGALFPWLGEAKKIDQDLTTRFAASFAPLTELLELDVQRTEGQVAFSLSTEARQQVKRAVLP